MEKIQNQERALDANQSLHDNVNLSDSSIEFAIGQLVALCSDPTRVGAMINVLPGTPENRYSVFIDNTPSTYYASQLQRHFLPSPAMAITPLPVFHAYMTALQLNHPSLTTLYSLNAARVNFVPYQFRPVLKFIHADRPRLLIADEVGVGKTIEAGLILRELQARKDVRSVLVLCPKPLVAEHKWQIEMKRFDEHFIHLDGPTLRHCIRETDRDGTWPEQYAKVILPFSLFDQALLTGDNTRKDKRRTIGLLDLNPPPQFDLVIVDEAHHLRNTNTAIHQGVRHFCEQAEAVIFLSATPIQMGTNDLFVLLNLLRPDLILDRNSFDHMTEPNPFINRAIEVTRANASDWTDQALEALQAAAQTPWGQALLWNNPTLQRLVTALRTEQLDDQRRVACIHDMEQLHTFSHLINRTRRRDIGDFTTRKPETVTVHFTLLQQQLHDMVLTIQQNILRRTHGDINVNFLMTTIRRQAASCLYGLAPLLRSILTRHIDQMILTEGDEEGDYFPEPLFASLEPIEEQIRSVLAVADRLDGYDPKWEALLTIVRDKQQLPNNKLLLFSSFLHTLFYLLEHLEQESIRVALIHGGTSDEDRRTLRDRFSRPREDDEALDVLLSSEVGCEGLDYQFCDCLVNYDLPWNPMRIEQRIGRLDRYGQKSETVASYNLITPGTVDAEIYERCLVRIGIFHQAVGGSEEILGRITSELRKVAENLTLTQDEIRARLQQVADNEIRLMREQTELEERQKDLFGIRFPAQQLEREIQNVTSFWLSPWALQNVIQYYLEQNCGAEQSYIVGEKAQKRLRLSQEARNVVLNDLQQLPRQLSPVFREWEKWLKGSSPNLSVTFEAMYAADKRDITFLNAIHPLAQQAAQTFKKNEVLYTAFSVKDPSLTPGIYYFGIWLWQKVGIRDEVTLQPICNDQALTDHFLAVLEHGLPIQPGAIRLPDQAAFDQLDVYHQSIWSRAQEAHKAFNAQLAQYRKESLQTSHRARISQLRTQLAQANEENIGRMRIAQIARAEADFNRRMNELDRAAQRADHLVFCHNGSPFTRQDVENITGFGNSDKPQQENKIGRFGIGFKSVFAITERPEIYTVLEGKPFAFAIEHLVVPVSISGNSDKSHHYDTQFLFPFNNGQEISLYSKIRKKLSTLGFETLLFLRNLASITWQTETDYGAYFCERNGSRRELHGERSRNGQLRQNSADYLMFTRNTRLSEYDRELDVSIAFRLDEKGKILAEPGQKLVVYFPTEQVTGLNFRMHGPFLLTENRANIKNDNKTNNKLIQECAILLGDSTQHIRKEDLLTVDFLSMLPIRKENVPPLFLPLYDQTLRVLKRYRLLPTADGTFASARQVKLARGSDLRELINERQLSALYGTPNPMHWLTSGITDDRTHDLYTYIHKELEVEIVDPEAFVRKLEKTFLERQTDEWLVQLFIFLSKQPRLKETIKWKPLLRLKDNSHVSPFKRTSPYDRNETPNAYLLREGKSKFPLVKRSLLADDTVYAFLKEIGLSEPDIVDEVLTLIIPSYEAGKIALENEKRNRQNLHYIQEALQRTSYQKRHDLISRLSKVPFIRASNVIASDQAWKTPREVYNRSKELLTWFEGNEQVWFITGSFPKSLLGDLNIPIHLQPRAKTALGSTGHIVIHNEWGFNQRGLHGFDPTANLDGLQQALELMTIDKAKILWNVLLKYRYLIKGVVETSNNKDFRNPRSEEKFSQMGQLCSKSAWLPNKNGEFCFPEELFLSDLPEGFEKSTNEAQELAMTLGMRKAEELQLADKLGIPQELISFLQRDREVILAWYQEQQQKKVPLPSSITNDPARRTDKAVEAAYNAAVKKYKTVSINRRISAGNNEARVYLRSHHTNAEGQLICQLCNQTMPFSLPNGEEYFEAYQYTEVLEKEYEANHLALCPNCAAEFKYACQTDEIEKVDLILDVNKMTDEANLVVYLDMPVHQHLRFTQRHLIDLQMATKDWLEANPNIVASRRNLSNSR